MTDKHETSSKLEIPPTNRERTLSNVSAGRYIIGSKTYTSVRSLERQESRRKTGDTSVLESRFEKEAPNAFFSPKQDLIAVKNILLGSWINLLILIAPFGIMSYALDWSEVLTFFLNFFGMIPLASILGDATESLADHLGETIGGLLNATFGNAVEIVVMILALVKAKSLKHDTESCGNLIIVVQSSLIGSIFSNSLLVLGCAFIANGIYYSESSFNVTVTSANVSLLMIAAFVMVLPSPYSQENADHDELFVSRAAALILLLMYFCLLFFVLYTHRDIMNPEGPPRDEVEHHPNARKSPKALHDDKNQLLLSSEEHNIKSYDHNGINTNVNNKTNDNGNKEEEEEDGDDDEVKMSLMGSGILLLLSTTIVAILSEFLVDSIEPMSEKLNMSSSFVGIILLPIIGNAVEHITAIRMALKNKMDISLSIAIGSATQVAMFVVGLAVIVGWILNLPLALDFPSFEVQLFIYSSIIIFALVSDGSSNWLEGAMLLCLYLLIAIAVYDQKLCKCCDKNDVNCTC